jgi:DNA-binding beta-propeller fold protein YncE
MLLRKLLFVALATTLTASLAVAQPPYLTQWGGLGAGPGQFDLPWGVAVNSSNGEVYVADQNNHRVQVFTSGGVLLRQFGAPGAGAGQFNLPYGIAVDATGDVYVTEIGNSRVQKLSNTGTPISMFGSIGSGNGQFNTPSGILIHSSGEIYVSDGLNHRIQRFSAAGVFLGKWGSFGSGAGSFRVPMGIAENSSGAVYVADQGNHRVQKFSAAGAFQSQFGTRGMGDEQFSFPQGIGIDSQDHIYVADMANHRMKEYDGLGNWVVNWGSMGGGNGQFNWPLGFAVDADDNVYVSELDNSRVQKFGIPGTPQAVTLTANIDILPESYPNIILPESRAPVTVALLGGFNFDVSGIRTASVTLNGCKPYRLAIGDLGTSTLHADGCHATTLGADGYDDVIFMFRTSDILTALPIWQEGETRLLTLNGTLDDGTAFAATDCVALRYVPESSPTDIGEVELFVSVQAPAGGVTRIEYTLPERAQVKLAVYDISGRNVATLANEWSPRGGHTIDWNSNHLSSGVYFVRLNTGEQSFVRRISLSR